MIGPFGFDRQSPPSTLKLWAEMAPLDGQPMLDESIEKQRRLSRTAVMVPWFASVVLQVAALVAETPETKALGLGLRIAGVVLMIVGLIFMRRHHAKERKWRETGKWE